MEVYLENLWIGIVFLYLEVETQWTLVGLVHLKSVVHYVNSLTGRFCEEHRALHPLHTLSNFPLHKSYSPPISELQQTENWNRLSPAVGMNILAQINYAFNTLNLTVS